MRRSSITILLSAFTATSALAGGTKYQDTGVPTPAPAPAPVVTGFDWTGGYVGVQVGYGTINYSNFNSQSGGAVGIYGGYRFDMGTSVVGVEGEFNPATLGSYNIPTGDRLKMGAALHLTYGMKLTADERTLLSFKVGPSLARTSLGGTSNTAFGLSAGIDVDHMLTDNIMLRGGLRAAFTNKLGSQNLEARSFGAGVGLGYRF
jgi:outer membrane immunogenic protein